MPTYQDYCSTKLKFLLFQCRQSLPYIANADGDGRRTKLEICGSIVASKQLSSMFPPKQLATNLTRVERAFTVLNDSSTAGAELLALNELSAIEQTATCKITHCSATMLHEMHLKRRFIKQLKLDLITLKSLELRTRAILNRPRSHDPLIELPKSAFSTFYLRFLNLKFFHVMQQNMLYVASMLQQKQTVNSPHKASKGYSDSAINNLLRQRHDLNTIQTRHLNPGK